MSSQNKNFICRWQACKYDLACRLAIYSCAFIAPWLTRLSIGQIIAVNLLLLFLVWLEVKTQKNKRGAIRYVKEQWFIYKKNTWQPISIDGKTVLWAFLVVVVYRQPHSTLCHTVVIWKAATSLQEFKRLRVFLRFAR
ncbi:protein YgfX [Pseudomonas sp. F1_0610]|uniref:protein YgfX n=1 Tax=Pseudomonas sp. F1_0610 TaxID=3114284 RepID=UPI0039C031FC